MSHSLCIMIVEPDVASRMRLRSALKAIAEIEEITLVTNCSEARSKIDELDRVDLIFLSERLPLDEGHAVISTVKRSRAGRDAACISVLREMPEVAILTADLLEGVDGFLVEPFSIDGLQGVITLADRVRQDRRELRLRMALEVLVSEMRDQINHVAKLLRQGHPSRLSREMFKEIGSVLRELPPESQALYYGILMENFSDRSNLLAQQGRARYVGVSDRIRGKVTREAVQRLRRALVA